MLCLLLLAGCQREQGPGRVIVLGLDGMEPRAIDLLLSEGKLLNFARLRREGAYGRLISSKPILSPILWTTVATGKGPDQHRIGHFVAVNEQTGEQLPVTSQMRKVKAVWNIVSDAGRQVAVVGWWATWPAETVRGTVISDHTCYHFLFPESATGARNRTGIFFPPQAADVLTPLIRRPADLRFEEITRFVSVTREEFARPFAFEDDLSHFKWALATAQTYEEIGLLLWQRERPDLLMTYIEGIDSTSHLFGHLFRAGSLAGELEKQREKFGNAVEEMYEYADEIVGRFIAAMDDRTTLIVLSDHGFELGVLPDDPSKLRDMRRVSELFHRLHGILYLYGRGVKAQARIDHPTLLDITPTVLSLLGLSPARDMPGRVLAEALRLPPVARTVDSYERSQQIASGTERTDVVVDPAILEHLRSLGYLDTSSPNGDRNLAAIAFENGDYSRAAEIYEFLLRENPQDGALHASLAGVYGMVGRFDEALRHLEEAQKLAPLNPEIYHNRAVIHERTGNTEAAIEEYRTALRYRPGYEPSRAALVRLTGSADVVKVSTEQEQRATILAERAAQQARRGDYAAAMKTLDEAEQLAPDLALLQQYRSNVAFLMGDTKRAIAALRRGLELEPGNALFRSNLEILLASPPKGN